MTNQKERNQNSQNIQGTHQTYSVNKLAKLAGVSVRTLHYYDEVGLLVPVRKASNNYREYGEPELLRLQQILFFKELEFPIEEIIKIMKSKDFDILAALHEHKKFILLKKKRFDELVCTIDKTIIKINNTGNSVTNSVNSKNSAKNKMTQNNNSHDTMTDDELYAGFSKEEKEQIEEWNIEAKDRLGDTDMYKESAKRVKKFTKADWDEIKIAGEDLMNEIVACFDAKLDAKSPRMQKAIARHYASLRVFYEPNPEMYSGLGEMYVADPRFTAYYEKYREGLAVYMRDAMVEYAKTIGK